MITLEHRAAWSHVPVDDVGYLPSADLLALPAGELLALVQDMAARRYSGWRNHDGLWRAGLGLDTTHGKRVLDFGCGVGLDALALAEAGNSVAVADISETNVRLAARVLELSGYTPTAQYVLGDGPLVLGPAPQFDVVVMDGVLHHIQHPVPVVEEVAGWLPPGGELRVMVYSDTGWRVMTGSEPPADVTDHPDRETFVRGFDAVGAWADWYSRARLAARFGRWFTVRRARYITPDSRYMTATLIRRPG